MQKFICDKCKCEVEKIRENGRLVSRTPKPMYELNIIPNGMSSGKYEGIVLCETCIAELFKIGGGQ